MLCLLERAGEISNIRQQVTIRLTAAEIGYRADFVVFDKKLEQDVTCEFKGFEQERWMIIKKLWKYYGPGLLRIYRKKGNRVYLHEEIWGCKDANV